MERERATLAIGWPLSAKAMAEDPSFGSRDLSSLRGGNLYAILPEPIRPPDPELRSNPLGMTETCGPHCYYDLEVELPEVLRGSAGRPIPGIEHRIVDPDTSQLAAPGVEGEICVRGQSLMQGLYKVEREDTFDADGFYRTSDLGWFGTEGHLFFTGRSGEMIKTAGANVAPKEVEIALESLPEVLQAHVVGVADPDRGQLVVAAVALREGAQATPAELRESLRGDLSSYKLPRHVLLFETSELPFLETGKIDKRSLQVRVSQRLEALSGDTG
jgi:acyl-CoA synthetase (AMP-forming)/AMP-acid ligase II